jgi:mono/diheme cytochrome c family protein
MGGTDGGLIMENRSLLFVLFFLWIIGTFVGSRISQIDPSKRRPDFLMDMAHSPAYEAQGANPLFEDDRNLRMPVEGTIARGFMPFQFGVTPEEAKRAGREVKNPLAQNPEVIKRGRIMFGACCAVCHGSSGKGDGPVTKKGVPPPPSLLLDNARLMADGEMYHAITLGKGNMPSHAAQVARDDRWKIIHYVRSLQEAGR